MDTTQTTPLANVGYIPHHSVELFLLCSSNVSHFEINAGGRPLAGGMMPEPMPEWLTALAPFLIQSKVFRKPFNHVLINEYQPGQGIMVLPPPPFESICRCQRASPSLPAPIFLASRRWTVVHSACGHSQSSKFGGDGHLCQTRHATEQSLFSALRTR